MSLSNAIQKLERLKQFDIAKETADIINENGAFVSSLLKKQLAAGKDGEGGNVTVFGKDYYSDRTIFEKERLGLETRWITNRYTGAFYDSIYAFASGHSFILDSGLPYFNAILAQSGPLIMELSKENLRILSEEIVKPQLQIRFNSLVGV